MKGQICKVDDCGRVAYRIYLCHTHYNRVRKFGTTDPPLRSMGLAARFWAHVSKSENESGCWVWAAATSAGGYGQIYDKSSGGVLYVHRLSYEIHRGAIPDGLHIDHLCQNTRCVNPDHLEVVSAAENTRRVRQRRPAPDHCPQGHPFDEANTYFNPTSGWRACRACNRERQRLRKANRPSAA